MDLYSELPTTLTAPARSGAAIVPSNSTDLTTLPRAIYVGQTGDISLRLPEGGSILLTNVQSGSFLPIRAIGVNATGTTAGSLLALW